MAYTTRSRPGTGTGKLEENLKFQPSNKLGQAPHGFIIMLIMPIILPFLGQVSCTFRTSSVFSTPPLLLGHCKTRANLHRFALTSPRPRLQDSHLFILGHPFEFKPYSPGLQPENRFLISLMHCSDYTSDPSWNWYLDSRIVSGFSILSECGVANLMIYG